MILDAYNIAGFIGAVGIVANYAYMQWKRNYVRSLRYSVINAVAAACMCLSLSQHLNMASLFINFFWLLISLYGIYRCTKYKHIHVPAE